MRDNDLKPIPINNLLEESFFIPAYQRGYRWTKRQVIELLEDIGEFQKNNADSPRERFYCLQPLVVKQRGDEWEVVDGQQRLTTIRIIINCLKKQADALDKTPYRIHYETRPGSADFLDRLDENRSMDNIDFHHMYEAKTAIEDWFESKERGYKMVFLQTLLGSEDDGRNVKVIWYQINEEVDATTVFTRLNVGKIPLTNGELVKALFLKSGNFDDSEGGDRYLKQLKIAQEWDDIERTLQKDDFWYFLSNQHAEANRIELILKLIADQLSPKNRTIPRRDDYYVFLVFAHWLEEVNVGDIPREWGRIKRCFMTLNEWFCDPDLFHMVGFLVSRRTGVGDILKAFNGCSTKTEFRAWLKAQIFRHTFPGLGALSKFSGPEELKAEMSEFLDQLSYENNRDTVVSVLLLFNVATLFLGSRSSSRFQFDQFKIGSWDIEHIRSVSSDIPQSTSRQKGWLSDIVDYFKKKPLESTGQDKELRPEIGDMLEEAIQLLESEKFSSEKFEALFSSVHKLYAQDSNGEAENSIGNLALLDSTTNRSYKNAIFPIKRNRIISLDRDATFVPICTKNVFLKYYSDEVDSMLFWNTQDIECHKTAMTETLCDFFKEDKRIL